MPFVLGRHFFRGSSSASFPHLDHAFIDSTNPFWSFWIPCVLVSHVRSAIATRKAEQSKCSWIHSTSSLSRLGAYLARKWSTHAPPNLLNSICIQATMLHQLTVAIQRIRLHELREEWSTLVCVLWYKSPVSQLHFLLSQLYPSSVFTPYFVHSYSN